MTTIATTLRQCHEIVWTAREELKDVWKIPPQRDALIFALSELGEVADAMMRTKPEYARNNDRDMDVLDEWADYALMLFTALGPHATLTLDAFFIGADELHGRWLSGAALDLSWMLEDIELDGLREASIWWALNRVANYPGMDLPQRLQQRLERIRAKRLPVPTVTTFDEDALLRQVGGF